MAPYRNIQKDPEHNEEGGKKNRLMGRNYDYFDRRAAEVFFKTSSELSENKMGHKKRLSESSRSYLSQGELASIRERQLNEMAAACSRSEAVGPELGEFQRKEQQLKSKTSQLEERIQEAGEKVSHLMTTKEVGPSSNN